MAHRLASDLGVSLELVRVDEADIGSLLQDGRLDIVMSGLAMTPKRALQWDFSASPMDLTMGFLVKDHRRKAFSSLESIRKIADVRVGMVEADTGLHHLITAELPNATLESVASPREFLRGDRPDLDAIVYSAEGGSAWTLLYPAYAVVVPSPGNISLPMSYALPKEELEWLRFVSDWVLMKQKTGDVSTLFDHWIQGSGARDTRPRWSVIRNVLHWVQ